jgi:hypothetical protein
VLICVEPSDRSQHQGRMHDASLNQIGRASVWATSIILFTKVATFSQLTGAQHPSSDYQ